MDEIELVAVPFDGYGRPGNQALAAAVLRDAGLAAAASSRDVIDGAELSLPARDPTRGRETSLINEAALVAMVQQVGDRVASAVQADRFPIVYGGDCTTLLGTIPALGESGAVGLLFIDGHEDTMPLDVSEDGEAANTEIGLLLGLTGRLMTGPLRERLPALEKPHLAVLGPRDVEWRRQFNVGSLSETGVWLNDWQAVASNAEHSSRAAADHLLEHVDRWWLHVDLDVLDPLEFPAQGLPDVEDEPGGLTWEQLTRATTAAVARGGCIGWSIAIYDPEQDPDRSGARRILELVHDVTAARRRH